MWHSLLQRRAIWLGCLALLLASQLGRQVYSAANDAQTFDESIHIGAGYAFLRTGDYTLDTEHPPLGRVLATLPLLALGLDAKLDSEAWRNHEMVRYGQQLIYQQPRMRAETVLFVARIVPILLTCVLTLLVALWTRARFGPAAGLLAGALMALDPNLAAHGHIVTTDFPAAFTVFLACIAFERLLRRATRLDIVWTGMALGAALGSKFSTVFLVPAFLMVWALTRQPWQRTLMQVVGVGAISFVTLLATYGPETLRVPGAARLDQRLNIECHSSLSLRAAAIRYNLPTHPLLLGANLLACHQERGHHSYLLGDVYDGGRRDYFPIAFLSKTPLGALLLLLLTLPLWRKLEWGTQLALAVPLVVFWTACIGGNINLGLRHLLPVYPLTYALASGCFAALAAQLYRTATPALAALALLLLAGESAWILPYDLAFFNLAAGGPAHAPAVLLDSNIDWGQDLLRLNHWLGARKKSNVCLIYFGLADPAYYGFEKCGLPSTDEVRAGVEPERRWIAVSLTLLYGIYHPPEWFVWLQERQPQARIGWSIYVYDVNDLRPRRRMSD